MYRGRKGSLADFIKATHRKQSISTDFISIKESTKRPILEKDIENADNKQNDIETKRRKDDSNNSNGVNAESGTNNERNFKNAVDVIRYRMQRSNELRLHLTESRLEGQLAKADDNKSLNYETEKKEIEPRQKENNQIHHGLDESEVDFQTASRDSKDQLKEQPRKSDDIVATSTHKSDTETIKITKGVKGVDSYKEAEMYEQDAKTTSRKIAITGEEHDIRHEIRSTRSTDFRIHSNVSVSTTQDQNLDEVSLWSSREGEMNSTSGSHKSGSVDETRSSREFLNAINDWKNSKDLQKHVRRNRSQNDERRLQIWLKSKEGREAQQRRRRSISARMRDRKARGYSKRNSISMNGNESGNDMKDSLAKLMNNREADNTCDNENKIDENINRETAEKRKESEDIQNKQDTSDSNSDEELRIERLGRIGSAMTERIIKNTIENIESIEDQEKSTSGSTRPKSQDNEEIAATEKTASSYEDTKATSGDSSDDDRSIEKLGRIGSAVTERIIANTMENMQSDGEVSSDIDDTKTKTEHSYNDTATNKESGEGIETEKNVNDGKTIDFHSGQKRKQQTKNVQPNYQTNNDQSDDKIECAQITSTTEMKAVQQGEPTKDVYTEHQTKCSEQKNQERDAQPVIEMNDRTRDDRQWDESKHVRTHGQKKVFQQENQMNDNQLKERKMDIQPGDVTKDDPPNNHKDVQPQKQQNNETRVVQLNKQSEHVQLGDKPKIPLQIQKKDVKEDGQLKVVIPKEHMKNAEPKEDTNEIQQKDQPKYLQPKDQVMDQTNDIQQRYQTTDGHQKDERKDMQQTDQTNDKQLIYQTKDDQHDQTKYLQPKEQMNDVIPKEQVKDVNSKNETMIVQSNDQIKDPQPKEQMKDVQQKEQMKNVQPNEQKKDVPQKDKTTDVQSRSQTKDVQQANQTENVRVHPLNVQSTSTGSGIETTNKGNISNESVYINKTNKDVKEKFVPEVQKDPGNSNMAKEQPLDVKNNKTAEMEHRIRGNSEHESNFIPNKTDIVNVHYLEEKDIENRTNPKNESNNQQDDQGKQHQRGKYSVMDSGHKDKEEIMTGQVSISDEDVLDAHHSDSPSIQINDKRIMTQPETHRNSEHLPSSNVHQNISSGSPNVHRYDEDDNMSFIGNRMKEKSETRKQLDKEDNNSLKINEQISGPVDKDLIRKDTTDSEINIPEKQNLNSGEDEVEVTCSRESVSVQTDHVNIKYRPNTNNSTSEASKHGEILSTSQKSQKGETSSRAKRDDKDIEDSKDKKQDRYISPEAKNNPRETEIRHKDKEQDKHTSPEAKNNPREAEIWQKNKEQDRHTSQEAKNNQREVEIRHKDKEQDRHTSPEAKNNPREAEIRQKDKEQDRHTSPEAKNNPREAEIRHKHKEQDRHTSPEAKNNPREAEIRHKDKEQDKHTSPEAKNNPREAEIWQKNKEQDRHTSQEAKNNQREVEIRHKDKEQDRHTSPEAKNNPREAEIRQKDKEQDRHTSPEAKNNPREAEIRQKDKEQDRHTSPEAKNNPREAEIRHKDKEQDRHTSQEAKNNPREAEIRQKDKEQDRHTSPEAKDNPREAEIRQKDKKQDRHTSPEAKSSPTEAEIRQIYEGISQNENPDIHKTVQRSRDVRAKASPKLSKAKDKDKKTEQIRKEQTDEKSTGKQLKSAKNSPSRRSYVNSPSSLAPSLQKSTKKERRSSKASMKTSSKDRTFSEDTNDILNKLETIDKQLAKLETHEEYESTDGIFKQNPEYQPEMDTSENEMTGNNYPETDESIEIIVRNGSPHRSMHQDERANDFEVLVRIPSASTDRSENILPMHQLETPRKSIKITSNDNDIKIVINKRKDGLNNGLDSSYRLGKERSFTRLRHISLKEQEDDDDQIMYFIKHAQAEQRARVDKLIEEIYYIKSNEQYLCEKLSRGQTTVHTWRPMKERSIKMYGDRRNFLYSGSEDNFHSFSKFASYSREVQQFVGFVAPKKQDAPKPAPELVIPTKSRKQRAYGELKKKLKHLY